MLLFAAKVFGDCGDEKDIWEERSLCRLSNGSNESGSGFSKAYEAKQSFFLPESEVSNFQFDLRTVAYER